MHFKKEPLCRRVTHGTEGTMVEAGRPVEAPVVLAVTGTELWAGGVPRRSLVCGWTGGPLLRPEPRRSELRRRPRFHFGKLT